MKVLTKHRKKLVDVFVTDEATATELRRRIPSRAVESPAALRLEGIPLEVFPTPEEAMRRTLQLREQGENAQLLLGNSHDEVTP